MTKPEVGQLWKSIHDFILEVKESGSMIKTLNENNAPEQFDSRALPRQRFHTHVTDEMEIREFHEASAERCGLNGIGQE